MTPVPPDEKPTDTVEERLEALEARLAALESAVSGFPEGVATGRVSLRFPSSG